MAESKRKIVIKPFRSRVQVDRLGAEKILQSLADAIDEIHNRNSSLLSFEELYRNAYNLVIQKHGYLLYHGVSDKLSSHLRKTVEQLAGVPDTSLLEEVSRSYSDHTTTMMMVKDILMYMDRTYASQEKLQPMYELGLHLYRRIVWDHSRVQNRVSDLLLQTIANERIGILTDDRTLIKDNLNMLQELGSADNCDVYEKDFDGLFLGTTQEFYRNESSSYLAVNTASNYVQKAKARLDEEKARAIALSFPPTTERPLFHILQMELIERHAKSLVTMENSGFSALLKDETKMEDMQNIYSLFARVPSSVDFLRDALSERVKSDGKALILDQERGIADSPTFVRGVLQMRERYGKVVEIAFQGEQKAAKRLKESFEHFLNGDARAASCLAVYSDELLRSKLKGATETEVMAEISKVIVFFRYLSDKDIFESYYKQHLAKRLLSGRTVGDEAERGMVSELKKECGYQFTSKLEGMFTDMRISRDTRDAYKKHKIEKEKQRKRDRESNLKTVDIDVDVLTTGYWPSQNVPVCNLPSPINDAINRFSEFYLQQQSGRKLSWQTSTGTAEIRSSFGKGSTKFRVHDLCVSTYQMCILVLFNDKSTWTLGEIRSETQIPDMELRRHLISLCTPKHRILRKGSKGKGINSDNDSFTFNVDYTSKMRRVKIPLVSMREASTSKPAAGNAGGIGLANEMDTSTSNAVPATVEEDRRHLVEAATVRIMKARSSLHHNELIAEVTKQLSVRFVPKPQFIKKRIECLIEREYLERAKEDHRRYLYVA